MKKEPSKINLHLIDQLEAGQLQSLGTSPTMLDEFWSYVGSKSNQSWAWYAIERRTGIVAYHLGKRTEEFKITEESGAFTIKAIYTDD